MTHIIAKREIRKGRWIVIYEHTCSCGCTTERKILVFNKEPTDKQIKKAIDENHS